MHRAKIVVVAVAVLAFAGCGDDGDRGEQDAERICRSQHDATVCLEREAVAQGGPWRLVAEGFKPGSLLTQELAGDDAQPIESMVGDDGRYPRAGSAGGLVVPPGQRATLFVRGTAANGQAVRITISRSEE